MEIAATLSQLTELGLNKQEAEQLLHTICSKTQRAITPEQAWQSISQILHTYAFSIHLYLFNLLFPHWHDQPETAPAWVPDTPQTLQTNLFNFMSEQCIYDVKTFHQWTIEHFQDFWKQTIDQLNIVFKSKPQQICDLSQGIELPQWLPGATLNIADSCFTAAASATALIYEDAQKQLCTLSYGELDKLTNRIANSLIAQGFTAGDAIGIAMPMHAHAVAAYLGVIKMGGVVVAIADSFSSHEIGIRLQLAKAKAVITQDYIMRGTKKIPLYERIQQINIPEFNAPAAIVLPYQPNSTPSLRSNDIMWDTFLVDNTDFCAIACEPMAHCNVLFSSGTPGAPKAIPWNHTTAIKAASDAYFHQNIQPGDILTWPTNLGWMMGPWLVFASFINHAAIALYTDAPKDRAFGEFVQHAKVTMLGVVPTLVSTWRQSQCMEGLDWQTIKVFSSTGEASNPEDMLYLMSLAGYKPVIEYCGGTEIGGAYVSSTLLEPNYPSLFSTPTMGLNFTILDEQGYSADQGEVAITPPSIGLSTHLLNANHHDVYFANMPSLEACIPLRRHGDQIRRYCNGYYSMLGRADDTMNLGGIKTSAIEIERTIAGVPEVVEQAAIAISPNHAGPSQLIIYAVTAKTLNKSDVLKAMQKKINAGLNPLFKIHDVVFTSELPKTASNKIMRRTLRKQYLDQSH